MTEETDISDRSAAAGHDAPPGAASVPADAPRDGLTAQQAGAAAPATGGRHRRVLPLSPLAFRDPALPFSVRAWILVLGLLAAFLPIAVPIAYLGVIDLVPRQLSLLPYFILAALFALLATLVLDLLALRLANGHEDELLRTRRVLMAGTGLFLILLLGLIAPLLAAPALLLALLLVPARLALMRLAQPRLPAHGAAEVTAILAGRNGCRARLPVGARRSFLTLAFVPVTGLLAALLTLAAGSMIAEEAVITQGGVLAASLAAGMALCALAPLALPAPARSRVLPIICPPEETSTPPPATSAAALFADLARPQDAEDALSIHDLEVRDREGRLLLHIPQLELPGGSMIAVDGPPASGKSLFLRTLADPWCIEEAAVRGRVHHQGVPLWRKARNPRALPCLHVGPEPVFLPVSIAENIVGTGVDDAQGCAQRALEKMGVFDDDAARILARPSPAQLTESERRIAALARALHFQPSLYLIDRPEVFLDGRLLAIFLSRLKGEVRAGRTVLLATSDRRFLEECDHLLRLDHGRIAQAGAAAALLGQGRSGWQYIHLDLAEADAEDRLHLWLRSMFTRRGDEPNRRRVSLAASQLVAALLHGIAPDTPHPTRFGFRHHKGFCQLSSLDDGDALTERDLRGLAHRLSPWLVTPSGSVPAGSGDGPDHAAGATSDLSPQAEREDGEADSGGSVARTPPEARMPDPQTGSGTESRAGPRAKTPPLIDARGLEQSIEAATGLRRLDLFIRTFDPRREQPDGPSVPGPGP